MSGRRALSLWGPVVLYLGLIFWGSSRSQVPRLGPDTGLHLIEYAGLGALLARALAGGAAGVSAPVAIGATLAGSAYGLSDELHQRLVPGRQASIKDWFMDTMGSALGAGVLLRRARRRPGGGESQGG